MDAKLTCSMVSTVMELVIRIKRSVEELGCVEAELKTLECYLKDASEKQDTDKRVRDYIIRDMRKTLCDVEEDLEWMLVDCEYPSYSSFGRTLSFVFCLFDECFGRGVLEDLVTASNHKIRACVKNLELLGVKKKKAMTSSAMPVEGVNFRLPNSLIGLGDDIEMLLSFLLEERQDPRAIIAIHGMAGVGKTALAKGVYHDPGVRRYFEGFAWVKVGHKFRSRNVVEDIFSQLAPGIELREIMTFTDFQLVFQLFDMLQYKRYLIVLDGVCDEDAWICLSRVFPLRMSTSKLIVTTRSTKVAEEIAHKGIHKGSAIAHQLRSLTEDGSWELFAENAFLGAPPGSFASNNLPDQSVHILLNGAMHEIALNLMDKCGGLPLALVSLGKLLGRKHTLEHWKLVQLCIDRFASTELDSEETKIPRVLALTHYFDLPYYLRPCFLYLGLFPEDFQISSEKLTLLWAAEGFIHSTHGKSQTGLEDTAQCYLVDLINRSLVQVQEGAQASTRSKILHVCDLIRDMCVLKGKEENFMDVMDLGTSNQLKCFDPKTRRLALYFYKNGEGNPVTFKDEKIHSLRSLLLFNCNRHQKDMTLLPDFSNLKHLKFLRVLHFDGFNFGRGKSLKGIGELTILVYLSFSQCTLDELPSSIGNLTHLETLDLRVETSTRISLPNVLWRIESLRRLYLPLQFRVHRDEKLRLDSLKNLETVQNFDASLCVLKDLFKFPKLCHLEVTTDENLYDLETIANNLRTTSKGLRQLSFNVMTSNCYSERRRSILANLFEFPALYNLRIEGYMVNLPKMISSSLTGLVLSRARLVEDPMATLEKLPRLQMLSLNDDAYLGKQMVCSASGFPELRVLKLSTLHNLENLSIEKGAMPNLSTLSIEGCWRLGVTPEGFNHLPSLQNFKIAKCHLELCARNKGNQVTSKLRIVIDWLHASSQSTM